MSVPYSSDIYQAVVPGGSVTFQQMFETSFGSGIEQPVTGVTVTITLAGSPPPLLGPTSAGVVAIDTATYSYTWNPAATVAPGNYLAAFTGTGPNGPIVYTQAVLVASPPSPVPMPGVYATLAQYQAWSGDSVTPASLVTPTLQRASEVLDYYLKGAVYATDADSMPTDAGVIDVFMRATCAQCQFMIALNDPAFVKSQYASTSMGGVALTRSQAAQGRMVPLAPMAAVILGNAGVLPGAPLINW
jgi:hypothetical protein